MHKVLIDSDIILDLLAKREPFYKYSAALFTHIEDKEIEAFTTPIIISNIHYILAKIKNKNFAKSSIRKIRLLLKILNINEKIIDLALESSFKDFEDAIQYYTAKDNRINFIITRNISDYKESVIKVCTAEEYIKILEKQKNGEDIS